MSARRAAAAALVFAALCFAPLGCEMAKADMTPGPTHDSLGVTWTHDGEAIRWYVFEDPDTGTQYLVNDRGGCVERGGRP